MAGKNRMHRSQAAIGFLTGSEEEETKLKRAIDWDGRGEKKVELGVYDELRPRTRKGVCHGTPPDDDDTRRPASRRRRRRC